MNIYLCGGINGLSDDQAVNWRQLSKSLLTGICLDPMSRDYRGKEDESVEEIYRGDLSDIIASDIILVNAVRPSWGTAMEMVYAKMMGKYVVIVTPPNLPVSPWLRKHSDEIHHSFESACDSINGRGAV
jgi:hypothetical protein